jgi:hypothetical protein
LPGVAATWLRRINYSLIDIRIERTDRRHGKRGNLGARRELKRGPNHIPLNAEWIVGAGVE